MINANILSLILVRHEYLLIDAVLLILQFQVVHCEYLGESQLVYHALSIQ
jgi:hypothetical protein